MFVRLVSGFRYDLGNLRFIAVLPSAFALNQFETGVFRAGQRLLKGKRFDVFGPGYQGINLGQNLRYFSRVQRGRVSKIVCCHRHVVVGSFAADRLGLAERAVVTGTEVAIADIGELGDRGQGSVCPVQQVFLRHFECVHVVPARLEDRKPDPANVVQVSECVQGT